MGRDIMILLSGGVDSAVCAAMASEWGFSSCFIDYGQPSAKQEQIASRKISMQFGAMNHFEIRARLQCNELSAGVGAYGPRVVPGRNLHLINSVLTHVLPHFYREIWIGCILDDHADYEDCRQEWIDVVNAGLKSRATRVNVVAPLVQMTKTEVFLLAESHGIERGDTWSCYQPTDRGEQCGVCNSCLASLT